MTDISAIASALREGRTTAEALTADVFARIRANEKHNAALERFEDDAFLSAKASDALIRAGTPRSILEGVPFAVKANIAVKGHIQSCGSNALKDYRAPYAATIVERLSRVGAIPVCSANMDEFAMGSTGETSAFGATLNPHNMRHVAGGSSSGSAALVALQCVPFALGSDTGGSVRLPAAHCGVCGMKPTYGVFSRYGLAAYASSLDQIGVLAQNPLDILAVFLVVIGRDPLDATSVDFAPLPRKTPLRLAHVQNLTERCTPSVQRAIRAFVARASTRFPMAEDVRLPDPALIPPVYLTLACAEASANLARYDGVRYGAPGAETFGAEVRRRVTMGEFVLSRDKYATHYQRALAFRSALCAWFDEAFSAADCLILPTSPGTAPRLSGAPDEFKKRYDADMMTAAANLCGLPAISVPCGKDENGLPIGAQLIAPKMGDERLLSIASALLKGGEMDA